MGGDVEIRSICVAFFFSIYLNLNIHFGIGIASVCIFAGM
jgi:hypothetical protein